MIAITEITLDAPLEADCNMGPMMHGFMMQCIDTEYATFLHTQNMRPYTQQIYFDAENDCNIWQITTLTQSAYEQIILPLKTRFEHKNILRIINKKTDFCVENIATTFGITYEELSVGRDIKPRSPLKALINLYTPTTFKSAGEYMLYPQIPQILNNLYNRWNSCRPDKVLCEQQQLSEIIDKAKITDYHIQSRRFTVERAYIQGFCGAIKVEIRGTAEQKRIAAALLNYANYAGLGVKTALGMGMCSANLSE